MDIPKLGTCKIENSLILKNGVDLGDDIIETKVNASRTSYKDIDSDLSSDVKSIIIDDVHQNVEYDKY